MSKGPKKKPAPAKSKAKVAAKAPAKAKAAAKAPAKAPAGIQAEGADQTKAPAAKKTGGGKAAIAVIVFLSVLGAGATINWWFWSKAGPGKTATQAEKVAPKPEPMPEKAGTEKAGPEKIVPVPEKAARETAPKEAPEAPAEKLAAERRQLRQALDRLMTRMESIEKSLDQVRKIAQATTPPAEKLGSSTLLEGIPKRLDSLEESGGKIKALMRRMDKMEKDYAEKTAAGSIAPASGAGAGPDADPGAERTPGAGALVVAVGNLRRALATDGPFDKALRAVKALAGDSPEISAAVTLLAKNAPKGLATRATLAARFEALAGKIVQASREVEEKNWLDRAVNRMSKLVSWRRVDGEGGKSSVDALVAAAETRLKAGDLKTAIKAVEGLSVNAPGNTKAAAVAASWLADAKARVTADRAIAGLHLHALSLLAPAPLTPSGSEKG